MIGKIILIAFIFTGINCFSQEGLKTDKVEYQTGLTVGYVYANTQFISIGGLIGQNYGHLKKEAIGSGLCMDVSLNTEVLTIGQKCFVEGSVNNFGLRLNLINYVRGKQNDFRVRPEINFNFLSLMNISAGYALVWDDNYFKDISKFNVSVTYNFIK